MSQYGVTYIFCNAAYAIFEKLKKRKKKSTSIWGKPGQQSTSVITLKSAGTSPAPAAAPSPPDRLLAVSSTAPRCC